MQVEYEILTTFDASPDGVRIHTYAKGDVVRPASAHEGERMAEAVRRNQARAIVPGHLERSTKVTRAPKTK